MNHDPLPIRPRCRCAVTPLGRTEAGSGWTTEMAHHPDIVELTAFAEQYYTADEGA